MTPKLWNFFSYSEIGYVEYPSNTNNGKLRPEIRNEVETGNENEVKPGNDKEAGNSIKNLIVFMPSRGRLGNLLFQYSATIGIANYTNRKAVFDKEMLSLTNIFPQLKVNVVNKPPKSWKKITERAVWDFDEKFFNLPMENVTIDGYVSSFRYFEKLLPWFYRDVLAQFDRVLLTKAEHFLQNVKEQYEARNNGTVPKTVCVHVRRGDKATKFARDVMSHRLPPPEDILNAMKYMESEKKHAAFIIASDTKEWCRQHLHRPNVYVSNLTSFYEDFVLMSNCDDMIMTVGTFGWWASWLTSQRGGTVMYYKFPFVEGSKKDKLLNRHNSFPEDWIPYS